MFKRPLVYIAAALVCGIISGILDLNIFFLSGTCFLLLSAAFIKGRKAFVSAIVVVIFILIGTLRISIAETTRNATANTFAGKNITAQMTVTDFSDGANSVARLEKGNKTYKVYLNVKTSPRLLPGDIIKGEFSFRIPGDDKVNINGFSSYLSSRGIYITAYADNIRITGKNTHGISGFVFNVRRHINSLSEIHFNNNTQSLFNAMVLGDKSLLSPELSLALKAAGISHIAVVSGMHLSIVISVLLCLISQFFGKKRWGYLTGILAALAVTLFTGAGASVVRALITVTLFCLSKMIYRESDSFTSLSFAVFIMALFNPFVIMNVGFILSVTSVAGIILFSPRTTPFIKKILPGAVGDTLSVSASALFGSTPVLIFFFGEFSLYTLLSNVLVSFFASGIVICGMIFCAFSSIPVLSDILVFLIDFFSSAVALVGEKVLTLPFSKVSLNSFSAAFSVLWLILLLVIFYPRKQAFKKCSVILSLCTLLVLTASFYFEKNSVDLYFYTYGNDTMSAFIAPDTSLLVDCPDTYDADSLLQKSSSGYYDYLIVTDGSTDKIIDFAKKGNVKTIVACASFFTEDFMEETATELRKIGIRTEFPDIMQSVSSGNLKIKYIPLSENSTELIVPQIEYKEKTFVTLQGLSSKQINSLSQENKIQADYLYLPFGSYYNNFEAKRLCDGEILTAEKIYHQRNKKTVKFYN